MVTDERPIYATQVPDRPFTREKLWKGQRAVSDSDVEYYREMARSEHPGEAERARTWLERFERFRRET